MAMAERDENNESDEEDIPEFQNVRIRERPEAIILMLLHIIYISLALTLAIYRIFLFGTATPVCTDFAHQEATTGFSNTGTEGLAHFSQQEEGDEPYDVCTVGQTTLAFDAEQICNKIRSFIPNSTSHTQCDTQSLQEAHFNACDEESSSVSNQLHLPSTSASSESEQTLGLTSPPDMLNVVSNVSGKKNIGQKHTTTASKKLQLGDMRSKAARLSHQEFSSITRCTNSDQNHQVDYSAGMNTKSNTNIAPSSLPDKSIKSSTNTTPSSPLYRNTISGTNTTPSSPPDKSTKSGTNTTLSPPDKNTKSGTNTTSSSPPDKNTKSSTNTTSSSPPDKNTKSGNSTTSSSPPDKNTKSGTNTTSSSPPDKNTKSGTNTIPSSPLDKSTNTTPSRTPNKSTKTTPSRPPDKSTNLVKIAQAKCNSQTLPDPLRVECRSISCKKEDKPPEGETSTMTLTTTNSGPSDHLREADEDTAGTPEGVTVRDQKNQAVNSRQRSDSGRELNGTTEMLYQKK